MKKLVWLLLMAGAPALAQGTRADISCKRTKTDLVYDCRITLAHKEAPLDGAQVSVSADMPSMPMAHNVKPVKAVPGTNAGEYRARLALDMHGEWVVKLRISGPVRDQIVKKMQFN
jgi:hypothetical protein